MQSSEVALIGGMHSHQAVSACMPESACVELISPLLYRAKGVEIELLGVLAVMSHPADCRPKCTQSSLDILLTESHLSVSGSIQ